MTKKWLVFDRKNWQRQTLKLELDWNFTTTNVKFWSWPKYNWIWSTIKNVMIFCHIYPLTSVVMVKFIIFLIFDHIPPLTYVVVVIFVIFLIFGQIHPLTFVVVVIFIIFLVVFTMLTFVVVNFWSCSPILVIIIPSSWFGQVNNPHWNWYPLKLDKIKYYPNWLNFKRWQLFWA